MKLLSSNPSCLPPPRIERWRNNTEWFFRTLWELTPGPLPNSILLLPLFLLLPVIVLDGLNAPLILPSHARPAVH